MKTIVLSNLKQVFQTIMTLCDISKLHVTCYTNKTVMYVDVFDGNKFILLNKEYSEVFYHDYSNDIHVRYDINRSEEMFIEYYNRCESLNKEIEIIINENNKEIIYLNNRIETLKKHNTELNKANEQMSNKLAYYESEYQDIVAEKLQQSENRNYQITEHAMKIIKDKKDKINQLNDIINDKDMVINAMTKQINHLHKVIRQMKKK